MNVCCGIFGFVVTTAGGWLLGFDVTSIAIGSAIGAAAVVAFMNRIER